MRRLCTCLLALLVVAGCSTEVEGPEPRMDDDPDELSTDPSFVCNQAHPDEGTWIELDGEQFSPLVVDAIADESAPDVELPTVTLILRQGPAGEEVEERRYEIASPLGEEDGAVRWLDGETLLFKVDDELELAEGVYDIEVENPNGQVATDHEAFGVTDRPELHTAIPEMTCVAQGEREIVLEGDNFLVRGDEDEIPTMRIGGETVEVVEGSLTDCRELHDTFTDHQLCEEATVRVDEEQFEAGVYDIEVENFEPAGCGSIPEEDGVTLTVNDPPEVHDIEPSPVCSEQIEYTGMEVDGDEFITVEDDGDTVYPEVAVGDESFRAVDATGCEAVDSSEALAAQRCDGLLIDVEDEDLADQVADDVTHEDLEIVVTNPEPVGCHSTEEEFLTAMPRPQVDLVEPDPMCTAQYENTFRIEGHGFAEIDGNQPVVHIGEDETYEVDSEDLEGCTEIDTPDVPTASCDELSVTIPEGDLDVERNDVTVENPETAGCESTDDSTVQVVPPPTLTEVVPQPICTDQNERTLQLNGEDFLEIDGDLPEVAIGDEEFDARELQECDELPLDEEDRHVETCETVLVDVAPEDDIEADVHDVVVTNPEDAACHSEDDVTVETVPPPTVASIGPAPICSERIDGHEFIVDGDDFVVVRDDDGEERFPEVQLGTEGYEASDADGCDPFETDVDMDAERCDELRVEVDDDAVAAQVDEDTRFTELDVVVTNPEPVGCQSEEDDRALTAVPPPTIETVAPDPMCTEQFANTFEIEGNAFVEIDGEQPVVEVDGDTYEVDGASMDECTTLPEGDARSCEVVSVTIEEDDVEVGEANVDVFNPARLDGDDGCATDDDSFVRVVGSPSVDNVEPEPVCVADAGHEVTVTGDDFLDIDGSFPVVTIAEGTADEQSFVASNVQDCGDLNVNDETRTVRQCDELEVTVGPGLPDEEALHDVTVTNPEGAACSGSQDDLFATLPRPEVDEVDPRAICEDEGETSYVVTGNHFYEVDGNGPEISMDGWSQSEGITTNDCESVNDDIDRCTELQFDLDPTAVTEDVTNLVVHNPGDVGCSSEESDPLVVAGSPHIESTEPPVGCEDEEVDEQMTLHGRFLYEEGGEQPDVTFDGETESDTVKPDDLTDCDSADAGDFTINECSELTATVPEEIRDEDFEITVTAVDPVACGSTTVEFERNPVPEVEDVIPERICEEGGTLRVEGTDLMEDAEYYLEGQEADDVEYESSELVYVTFEDVPSLGELEFRAVNPGECGYVYEETIRSIDGPNPVYVDPPAVYDEMETQVTIYAAGLDDGSIDDVTFVREDNELFDPVSFEVDEERPSVVQARLQSGMLEDDDGDLLFDSAEFGVQLTEQIDEDHECSNFTDELLTATSELTVAVDEIDPDFGGQHETTSVDITALEQEELQDDEVQFQATPRVYLNPWDTGGDEDLARELGSLQFIDETELNGLVPEGLPVGDYDVVVVNPDGTVGVLFAEDGEGFEVTTENAPRISSVSPTSWTTNEDALPVEIEGEYFQQGLEDDPGDDEYWGVRATCQPPDPDEPAVVEELDDIEVPDDETIQATVDTNDFEQLSTCVIRVTNPDGNYDEYSPVTITNPAGNFVQFGDDVPFDTPRRAPTLFSGTPGDQANFLYVVGGDDGPEGEEVYADVEFSRLDQLGDPVGWDYMPVRHLEGGEVLNQDDEDVDALPVGVTLGNGVRIDDFIYLVGGYDGEIEQATDQVLRARVLDPRDTPDIVNLDIVLDEGEGEIGIGEGNFDPGTYYYQVSAVYSDEDEANPRGESLASDPQPIEVPDGTEEVSVTWDAPDQAPEDAYDIAGWRVYRNVDADDQFGDEQELATILDPDQTSFTDDNSETPDGDEVLPLGAVGNWDQVSTLNNERMVAGITESANPDGSDQHFIYAVGGENAVGEHLATYEFVTVDVDGPRQQDVDDMADIGMNDNEEPSLLGADDGVCPRYELTASVADDSNAPSLIDVDPQLFTLGGRSEGETCQDHERNIYVTTVTDDGHLEEWTQADNDYGGQGRYGHAGTAIADQAALVGGSEGEPDDSGWHSDFECNIDNDCPPTDFETSWSSLSANVEMLPRVWMGHLSFRGIWYLAGGEMEDEDGNYLPATNHVASSPP